MRRYEVQNSVLNGEIGVPGAKNSSLALLAAACMAGEDVILENVPDILDVEVIKDIYDDINIKHMNKDGNLHINSGEVLSGDICPVKSSRYRASYYFIGAFLHRFGRVSIGYPGGDNFGSRPIEQHVKGFQALGADILYKEDHYVVYLDKGKKLIGNKIYFDVITSGATMNILMAAVLAEGRTILKNAARDPEVVDLAMMLSRMGAKIKGAGTDTIVIDGVEKLGGCTHRVIPDRLIAGSLLIAAGATGGSVKVKDIIPEHLMSIISKLEEAGMEFEIGEDYIRNKVINQPMGIKVTTGMYPSFATDLQQPMTALLINANSDSQITEKIYPNRFRHCHELNKLGAGIIIKEGRSIIPGKHNLKGEWVEATDIRAGISLIIAGMMAEGTTYITGIEHLERGYPDVVEVFQSLGGKIEYKENLIEKQCEIETA
ncbi:UDP-N-acetylglucosamine 1-carboxyvinyltransferase [Oceanirhabdus seepicola]|uniref:UDP-N-acetylglucosamine 1-carboxyvinyltransferase n=1 Tax=Oceanirhabdus seepicola TaxID=2828781 RepID=A0A9J6P2I5_9CLOT|nr:UDP-N-acetylglucosamine 1-carboxyvinyltransferase [Oceanirhabdus seepicola]MCM1989728.1 UDP-N-acetylglucosamine 1-carboxyvinyltransferase [Oceanirhabdus seepicola]